ncbi:reverse transcriptase-like protein [Plakobranchus ocellatus]|uniref:Reverse transcriptase-like protein n=1 Tax=Plakobranchus ocellatus TaxID=259542 RepID=A0AAV3Y8Y9_9GAST|nr:reverse transcriptase-like protein [Plakobranchus ocellatus]
MQSPFIVKKKIIYRNLVEASLTYKQEIYHQTRKSITKKLDQIQSVALICLTGACRGTSNAALQVATNIEPQEVRRKGAILKYWARTIYNPQNPIRKTFRDPISQASNSHIENTPNSTHSATWTTHELAKKLEINEEDILKRSIEHAPWLLENIEVDTSLQNRLSKKKRIIRTVYEQQP